MHHDEPEFGSQPFPRAPLIGAGILIAVVVTGVAIARLSGFDPRVAPPAPAVETRALSFSTQPDGAFLVVDADTREQLLTLEPGEDGFLRASIRSINRERKRQGIPEDTPYQLVVHQDGHLSLEDTPTGRSFDLGGFGSTNTAVYAKLLGSVRAQAAGESAQR